MSDPPSGKPRRRNNGWLIAIALLGLGVVAALGGAWHRARVRPGLATQLDEPQRRGAAFTELLRANGLWGHVRKCFHDARPQSRGRAWERVELPGGQVVRAVRAVIEEEGGAATPAVAVFDETGTIVELSRNAWLVLLDGSDPWRTAAIVTRVSEPPAGASLRFLRDRSREALRVRGVLRLETTDGAFTVDNGEAALPADAATFRYDAVQRCLRGPEGGPGQPWQVDRAASADYCP